MKKLTQAELQGLSFKMGIYKSSKAKPFFDEVSSLQVGEGVMILFTEWPFKQIYSQGAFAKRSGIPGSKYKINRLMDDSGFVVTRVA